MGWRVIDKKRDMSGGGKYKGVNGRQSDRRKIARAPAEVIRVQVIDNPLITEAEYEAVQQIMDLKQLKHWRSETGYEHRFTYNGFLTCSSCGDVIHTALARGDYYACKGRRVNHRCQTKYMRRDRLEIVLDDLFANNLSNRSFLENCVETLSQRWTPRDTGDLSKKLTSELQALRRKRERVIDTYIEGVIKQENRDTRLNVIDADIRVALDNLARETTCGTPPDMATLVEAFTPLAEWEYWTRIRSDWFCRR